MLGLRAFHGVFIASSIVLSFGFAWWSAAHYGSTGRHSFVWMGGAGLLAGIGLAAYAAWFISKYAKGRP